MPTFTICPPIVMKAVEGLKAAAEEEKEEEDEGC